MILPTMTSEELAKEIMADYENVCAKVIHIMKQTRRLAIKSRTKHHQQLFEYKSPMKNDWLIFVNHYIKDPIFVPVVRYLNKHGMNGVMVGSDKVLLSHYTSHFLERYNERFLKNGDMTKLDLLKHFISHNPMVQTQKMPDDKDYTNSIFARFNQGMGFGYKEVLTKNVFIHLKTFVSSDMRFENQEEVFQKTSANYKAFWNEVYGYRNQNAFSDET